MSQLFALHSNLLETHNLKSASHPPLGVSADTIVFITLSQNSGLLATES